MGKFLPTFSIDGWASGVAPHEPSFHNEKPYREEDGFRVARKGTRRRFHVKAVFPLEGDPP